MLCIYKCTITELYTSNTEIISDNHLFFSQFFDNCSQPSFSFTVKLNQKDYVVLKTQFEPLLNCDKLKGFIDGTSPAAPPLISNSSTSTLESNRAYDDWFRKDQHLLSWILSSISEEVFTCVVGLKTSFGAWQSLEKALGFVSDNRQLQLQELTDEDQTVARFFNEAKYIYD